MKTFSDIQVQELFNILSNTLNETKDIDTQLHILNGLKDSLDIGVNDNFRVSWKNENVFRAEKDNVKRREKLPTFFYQDYILKRDLGFYKVEEIYVAPLMFEDTYVEITENKFAYVFAAILYNEITRCELLKKSKWKGKLHTPPFQLTQKQAESAWELAKEYKFQDEVATIGDYLAMIRNYDLSLFYNKRKQKRKCCVLLNKLTKELGDEWGKITVPISTNGEKTLENIKNIMIPSN